MAALGLLSTSSRGAPKATDSPHTIRPEDTSPEVAFAAAALLLLLLLVLALLFLSAAASAVCSRLASAWMLLLRQGPVRAHTVAGAGASPLPCAPGSMATWLPAGGSTQRWVAR